MTCEIRDVNGEDITVRLTLDGEEVAVQYGGGYVGEPMHLYIPPTPYGCVLEPRTDH